MDREKALALIVEILGGSFDERVFHFIGEVLVLFEAFGVDCARARAICDACCNDNAMMVRQIVKSLLLRRVVSARLELPS